MKRREFLKVALSGLGLFASSAICSKTVFSSEIKAKTKEFFGVLVDTTRCIGCRTCEASCAESHSLPIPNIEDKSVFTKIRKPDEKTLTVVNRFLTEKGEIYVKIQCMHCNQPGCVAACLVKAMKKRKEGPVTWDENCMGCRYCMVSCPFDIPKFEYDEAFGRIMKCDMCYGRISSGKVPACVEVCPKEALTFGTRRDILNEAKKRIYQTPGLYVPYIYGENEVGGTAFLYISSYPFEKLNFQMDLGYTPYPEYTTGFLYSVPVILILWPAFLTGIHYLTKERKKEIER
ncbi:MAG: 4Fe-4S dicluster domain-containing protein [Desulfobacterota bacterium]|nr:4Fe-4S dicluster domain-containing protein [Thermodesulfobacteriota bacterium]MDW8001272.1 4Fe-4S dicluster domain-containing protein [Deltaproteobacteria bacterium]